MAKPGVWFVSLLLASSAVARADTPARIVVVPVVVGPALDPDPSLVRAVADGLGQNGRWTIDYGTVSHPLARAATAGSLLAPADRASLRTELDDGARLLAADPAAASVAIARTWTSLLAAHDTGALVDADEALLYRAGGLLVASHLANGERDKAAEQARALVLLFPGRRAKPGDSINADTLDLLAAVKTDGAPKLMLASRPAACALAVNGVEVGRAPLTLPVASHATYHVKAACAVEGAARALTAVKTVVVNAGAGETTDVIVDAGFESALQNDATGTRLRFSSREDQHALEQSYARRLAEAFNADSVVFLSIGEVAGADWLNGRIYLRNGYQNRIALARLDVEHARSLGVFLATGKDLPGVVRRDEAAQMVAASEDKARGPHVTSPWYTDVPGWALTGVGAVGIAVGFYALHQSNKRSDEADATNDAFAAQDIRQSAQTWKFWSDLGIFGGAVMTTAGVLLLAMPEYSAQSELFSFAPVPGGGLGVLAGRF